jgi:hypothetical protein
MGWSDVNMLSVCGLLGLKHVVVFLLGLCTLLELKCVPVSGLLELSCAVLSVDRLLEFRYVLNLLNNLWWQSEVLKMVKVTSATMMWCPTR